jgi:8-oxo-dGTP pyrophosphatase MutT (NUDIX family)
MVGEPEGPVEDDDRSRRRGATGSLTDAFSANRCPLRKSLDIAMSDGKWRVTASRYIHKDRWIALRADDCVTDDGVPVAPYYVLEYPDWVEVVALDADDNVLLVRQYRHGMGDFSIELPAGGMDPGDTDPGRRGPRTAGGNRLRRRPSPGGRKPGPTPAPTPTGCTRSWPATWSRSPSRRTIPPNASSVLGLGGRGGAHGPGRRTHRRHADWLAAARAGLAGVTIGVGDAEVGLDPWTGPTSAPASGIPGPPRPPACRRG